jgi:hypothetical protein
MMAEYDQIARKYTYNVENPSPLRKYIIIPNVLHFIGNVKGKPNYLK